MVETAVNGEAIDLQPTLEGETLLLRPLRVEDFEMLHAAASDPLIWEVHPEPTRYQRAVFEIFFRKGIESKGALVVIAKSTGQIIGTSRYYDVNPAAREIAIGYTFITRAHWGGATNREMKRLMLEHIYQWFDTVWFHIGHQNWRSRRAIEKIGGQLAHIAPMDMNGTPIDYCHYRISRNG